MATDLHTDEAHEEAEFPTNQDLDEARKDAEFLERLRAGGVRLATASPNRPRVTVKQRPRWWAFVLRTLGLADA
jgi:hypothetical protein